MTYEDLTIDISQVTSLVIRIQGCDNAQVDVTEMQGDFSDNHLYHFVFGGSYGSDIVIRLPKLTYIIMLP